MGYMDGEYKRDFPVFLYRYLWMPGRLFYS